MLPGLAAVSHPARAENAPDQGVLAFKQGYYRDSQPGWDRVSVNSPQVYLLAPLAGEWSVEAAVVGDSISGATPRMHRFRTGATPYMSDFRRAGELRVTRYLPRGAVTIGTGYSAENDYRSSSFSINVRWSSDDNNQTWALGLASSGDDIDNLKSGGSVSNQHRRTYELLAGFTQVMTENDLLQLNLTHSRGRGFYTDPYKDFDQRPDFRNSTTAMIRWNHYVERFDASARSSYRYYRDTFGVKSHTVDFECVQPVGVWTVTPGLRYYSQGAANFYFGPMPNSQGQADYGATLRYASQLTGNYSADARLAAFGALAVSLKTSYALNPETTVDLKLEHYRQSAALKLGGSGSPYLDPFRARFVLVGITRKF